MTTITVNTNKSYDVLVGSSLLNNAYKYISEIGQYSKIAIITDDIVAKLHLNTLVENLKENNCEVHSFVIENGEQSKNHYELIKMYDFLSEIEFSRGDLLIALGGGVVGDITGYCAASYLRGVDYVQIPTTLLAQIDSSVGGKTAVNIKSGKNLVGAFCQPKIVLCDIDTLSTLSQDIFNDGMAEMIKYGAIRSKSLFDIIQNEDINNHLEYAIKECIQIKADIVSNDEFDKGERMLLNFGHTLGHSIEKYYKYEGFSHAKGVAIGMVLMSELGENIGITAKDTTKKLIECIKKYNLPTSTEIDNLILYNNCVNDKKRNKQILNLIMVKEMGEAFIYPISIDKFKEVFVEKNYAG